MSSNVDKITIEHFSKRISKDPDALLKVMVDAKILPQDATVDYEISNKEKEQYLAFLEKAHLEKSAGSKGQIKVKLSKVKSLGDGKVKIKYKSSKTIIKSAPEKPQEPKVSIKKNTELEDLLAPPEIEEPEVKQEVEAPKPETKQEEKAPQAQKTTKETTEKSAEKPKAAVKKSKDESEDSDEEKRAKAKKAAAKKAKQKGALDKRSLMQMASAAFEDEDEEQTQTKEVKKEQPRRARIRKQVLDNIKSKHAFTKPIAPTLKEVVIPASITVAELAKRLNLKAAIVIKNLMKIGAMATINQEIDQDTAVLVVEELGHKYRLAADNEIEDKIVIEYDTPPVARPPVITIMGHVDHGKTSLLDYIRKSSVTASESGGITQHIGAYQVMLDKGKLTFLDTPGHEAFTSMRSRGAKITDLVIIVVAADDGVKPQTVEAITHAKAANVPIIVAVNKMDKDSADPERVKNELTQHEIVPEDWGGDTMFYPISAKTGDGINELLEGILLQAEVLELQAPAKGPARGVIIESSVDKGRGVVSTILVKTGCLQNSDTIVVGTQMAKVRSMHNEDGQKLTQALPATPVEILGLSSPPNAGEEVIVISNEKLARELVDSRLAKLEQSNIAKAEVSLDDFFNQAKKGEIDTLNIIIKADVDGSKEVLSQSLSELGNDELKVKVVASGIGGISDSDINLALASKAIIIGFNVRASKTARDLAEKEKVQIYYFSIIYDVIDRIKNVLTGMLKPMYEEKIIGIAKVRDVFKSSKFGAIAGCIVTEGTVKRNNPIRVLRDDVVIYEGELESLRRFKDDANEVKLGTECGIGVKNYNDIKAGDQIEVYEKVLIERSI